VYIVCSFCMSFAPIIALLPFHFALIFTSFYLWSTFLLALLIDSFQFCISLFWIFFFFSSTQLFIPFNFAFIISTLFFMCHFFLFVPTSSTWTHLCFYISNFHPFNFTLSNCSFACSSPHPWPLVLCKFRFWLLAIIKLQLQTQSYFILFFTCYICFDTLCCFFILNFKFVFCIC
jgi:hypothetical protein